MFIFVDEIEIHTHTLKLKETLTTPALALGILFTSFVFIFVDEIETHTCTHTLYFAYRSSKNYGIWHIYAGET